MENLIRGVHEFQSYYFKENQELFEQLAQGQSPETLLITCSDSRIQPGYLMNTQPGELFIIRNAGNIIPPEGSSNGGEVATLEYAVTALQVSHIIVMGHSHCGAMQGLLHPEMLQAMPRVADWLKHCEAVRQIAAEKYADCAEVDLLKAVIKENVLQQLDHLRSYPALAERIEGGQIKLHAWVYMFETGRVLAYDPAPKQFVPLAQITPSAR